MANIFDVAHYILNRRGKMSTMKLQKLCYYSQAWSLVWDDAPLFDEDFQAWANGPVCRPLFALRRGYFSINQEDIPEEKLSTDLKNQLDENQIDTIDRILEHYGDKNGQWLSTLTHMEQPWQIARVGCADGSSCENIITKESMADYYASL